jgi:hypothetical protein
MSSDYSVTDVPGRSEAPLFRIEYRQRIVVRNTYTAYRGLGLRFNLAKLVSYSEYVKTRARLPFRLYADFTIHTSRGIGPAIHRLTETCGALTICGAVCFETRAGTLVTAEKFSKSLNTTL